eukprot:CAMPEP_0196771358 /NCGR_PEP_ID=MMETSP1104-20130614/1641_1 /TAXON_ID=33652 /ORGANISM="Cafeteria sp., Strain Caron Lab Isolate" /LENGTH=502 /DNA_ID=CAMNT_0042141477 /DNA_START=6 /DNA_END=1511 /DNA_ORIENTATION=+
MSSAVSAKSVRIFQADAFTDQAFRGNPAAVVLEPSGGAALTDDLRQSIAQEMNLSETAFVAPVGPARGDDPFRDGQRFSLRWLTPQTEVGLCGHATLAAAGVLFSQCGNAHSEVTFQTRSGPLTVRRADGRLVMSFPTHIPLPINFAAPPASDLYRAAVANAIARCVFEGMLAPDDPLSAVVAAMLHDTTTGKLIIRLHTSFPAEHLVGVDVQAFSGSCIPGAALLSRLRPDVAGMLRVDQSLLPRAMRVCGVSVTCEVDDVELEMAPSPGPGGALAAGAAATAATAATAADGSSGGSSGGSGHGSDVLAALKTVLPRASSALGHTFASRYFNPWVGIDEDPVNGSSHTLLGPYFAMRVLFRAVAAGADLAPPATGESDGVLWEHAGTACSVRATHDGGYVVRMRARMLSSRGGSIELAVPLRVPDGVLADAKTGGGESESKSGGEGEGEAKGGEGPAGTAAGGSPLRVMRPRLASERSIRRRAEEEWTQGALMACEMPRVE